MTKLDKIKKFISDNGLDFTGSGSELNSNCVVLAGYACYLDYNDGDDLLNDIGIKLSSDATEELMRVLTFAWDNDYGRWWEHPDAHSEYIFEDK